MPLSCVNWKVSQQTKLPKLWAFLAIRSRRACGVRGSNWPAAWGMSCAMERESPNTPRASLPPGCNLRPVLRVPIRIVYGCEGNRFVIDCG